MAVQTAVGVIEDDERYTIFEWSARAGITIMNPHGFAKYNVMDKLTRDEFLEGAKDSVIDISSAYPWAKMALWGDN